MASKSTSQVASLELIAPIVLAILFARGMGSGALRMLGIVGPFAVHIIADAFAGALVAVIASFVLMRLKWWRAARPAEDSQLALR